MSVKPWDLLNPAQPRTPEDIAKERIAICETCPKWLSVTRQCKRCGCFMDMKTKLAEAHCPLGKWGKVEIKTGETNA